MKRTIIALAVGAADAAQAAYADVTVSGNMNAGPAVLKPSDGSTGAADNFNTTCSNCDDERRSRLLVANSRQ
jgi:hypothetical protein